MMRWEAELVLDARAAHGEGPAWDAREGVLYWIDITGKILHLFDPRTGRERLIPTGSPIGCAAPRKAGGVVAALADGFVFIDTTDETITPLADPEASLPGNRFNDGKCDPAGRFWAGTCSLNCDVPAAGRLYRLDPGLAWYTMLDRLTIPNGLTWSPDQRTLYYIDTPTLEVWAFDYDMETGAIGNRRTVVTIPPGEGYPDGMTGDREGKLWVAHWGAGKVCRWDPDTGRKLGEIALPANLTSSCIFGGEGLEELYITTSRLNLSRDDIARQPFSGGLFRARPGVQGVPTFAFGG